MIRVIKQILKKFNFLYLIQHNSLKTKGTFLSLDSLIQIYKRKYSIDVYLAVDLGSGPTPYNCFSAKCIVGLDLVENSLNNVYKFSIGQESIPYNDCSIDCITCFDLLEHIPRTNGPNGIANQFIYTVNDIFRSLKPGGYFLSSTPIFPFKCVFSDPTHVNILTEDTFMNYFSIDRISESHWYGITADFNILEQRIVDGHLVCLMQKPF